MRPGVGGRALDNFSYFACAHPHHRAPQQYRATESLHQDCAGLPATCWVVLGVVCHLWYSRKPGAMTPGPSTGLRSLSRGVRTCSHTLRNHNPAWQERRPLCGIAPSPGSTQSHPMATSRFAFLRVPLYYGRTVSQTVRHRTANGTETKGRGKYAGIWHTHPGDGLAAT
jgi:hypothetical protein